MKVSVIIPVYNCQSVIGRCLDSIFAQTLSDIEIICVDDGSTDDTLCILKQYESKSESKNFKIVSGTHSGVFKARELGIMYACGEYIGFCDADDYIEVDMYEKLYNSILKEQADVAVCAYRRIKGDSAKIEMNNMDEISYIIDENFDVIPVINTAIWNKLIRREIALVETGFEKNPRIAEDMMYLLHVYSKAKKITFVKECLYNYIVNEGSAMSYVKREEMADVMNAMEKTKNNVLKYSSDEWREVVDICAFIHMGVSLPLRMEAENFKVYSKIGREIVEWMDGSFSKWKSSKLYKSKKLKKIYLAMLLCKIHMIYPLIYIYRKISPKLGGIGW